MGNVTVKALVWEEKATPRHHYATSIVGDYGIIGVTANTDYRLYRDIYEIKPAEGHYWPIEAAKAAAQSDYEARILSALSVPCLQEPVAFGVRHLNEDDEPEFTYISDDRSQAEAEADTYDGEVVPLYAQPIEVRDQAIRECAEILNDYIAASRSDSEALGFEQARDSILALLEGR